LGYRQYLDKRLKPHFGEMEVSQITKADILKYRSSVAKQSDGNLKPKTINKFIKCLNMILSEAADRFNFTPPHLNIKPLKEEKVHIEPFSIDEVNLILQRVRPDWRDYLLVRFFTGMRTGEIDGLKWENVDFQRREILVRETYSLGKWEYTKNDGSQREIEMSSLVFKCLWERYQHRDPDIEMVFHSRTGEPVHTPNFLRRVWKPLLAHLHLKYRKPYQTRHTAATLWLAAGENPNWIAKQMGHSTTNMLFSVYARYVPNLTRKDGSAMERMLAAKVAGFHGEISSHQEPEPTQPEIASSQASEAAFWDQFITSPTSHSRNSIGGGQ
jgi:integrase